MMDDTEKLRIHRQVQTAARRCHECDQEALGRCPDCRKGFCQDHFPKQQHSPCAERQMRLALTQVCYVCGIQVYPDQWSLSRTSHYIDNYTCQGCGRHICDELHTQRKSEYISVVRDGMRGHRYQHIARYCDACSPLHRLGGIRGLTRWIVVAGTVFLVVLFSFHP
jgi:hypothetical protein